MKQKECNDRIEKLDELICNTQADIKSWTKQTGNNTSIIRQLKINLECFEEKKREWKGKRKRCTY